MAQRRKKRDIYGNWTWDREEESKAKNSSSDGVEQTSQVNLDWRDYIAISIASLETFLLPMVVFIVILVALAIFFAHG